MRVAQESRRLQILLYEYGAGRASELHAGWQCTRGTTAAAVASLAGAEALTQIRTQRHATTEALGAWVAGLWMEVVGQGSGTGGPHSHDSSQHPLLHPPNASTPAVSQRATVGPKQDETGLLTCSRTRVSPSARGCSSCRKWPPACRAGSGRGWRTGSG